MFGFFSTIFRSSPEEAATITDTSENQTPKPAQEIDLEGPNSHLANYINYYKSLEAPEFAVLVTGEWGTGKTHLMRKLLPWEGGDKQSYHVSFFGLKSTAEVDAAVYAEMYPARSAAQEQIKGAGEAVRGVSAFGFNAGGLITGGANLLAAYMRKEIDRSKPIIFDDLERSSMASAEEKLGVINYYVEHKRCRVIVIAHDEKLVDAIIEAKEKIFGQTIRIEHDTKSAFAKFRSELADDQIADLIGRLETVIVGVFTQSKAKSLRISRHVMFDLERFFVTLENRHVENENAMRDVVPLFVALAIAARTNTLDSTTISNRHGATLRREMHKIASARGGKEIEPSKFEEAQKLYSGLDLENQVLNDSVLIDMLMRGRYNKQAICASLDNSTYFAKTDELPPWRKVMGFDKLPDNVVEEAVSAMEQQIATRAVTEVGEMLHIFALRMMMAKHGVLARSVEEVVEESRAYIDALLSEERLPASYVDDFDHDIRGLASHGYTFWVEDSYKELFFGVITHLEAQLKVARVV